MSDKIEISIIMPTFNAERTLEKSLTSIVNQTLPRECIEILVIDGGSTDQTVKIAERFGAKILKNEKRLPEIAKQIGVLEAAGRYGVFIDSDEIFADMNSLERRIQFLAKHSEVKNIVSTGMRCKENETGIVRYANFIGDPFSNFVYRFNGYDRSIDLRKQYSYIEEDEGYIFRFDGAKHLPLFDALGNMFEIEYARKVYHEMQDNQSFAANIFSNMVATTNQAAMLKDDFVVHDAGLTRKTYLSKLKWRVKNNLFQKEGVGFAAREKKGNDLSKRKLLFVPYCILIVPVLVDAIRLSIKNRDVYFMSHFLYTEYVFVTICVYVLLKIFKVKIKEEKTYGKK